MNATIERNFKFHPSSPTAALQDEIRAKGKEMALLIDRLLPDAAAREKAMAITDVERATIFACEGLKRHTPEKPKRPGHD